MPINGNMDATERTDYETHQNKMQDFNAELDRLSAKSPLKDPDKVALIDAINRYDDAVTKAINWVKTIIDALNEAAQIKLNKWVDGMTRSRDQWTLEAARIRGH